MCISCEKNANKSFFSGSHNLEVRFAPHTPNKISTQHLFRFQKEKTKFFCRDDLVSRPTRWYKINISIKHPYITSKTAFDLCVSSSSFSSLLAYYDAADALLLSAKHRRHQQQSQSKPSPGEEIVAPRHALIGLDFFPSRGRVMLNCEIGRAREPVCRFKIASSSLDSWRTC